MVHALIVWAIVCVCLCVFMCCCVSTYVCTYILYICLFVYMLLEVWPLHKPTYVRVLVGWLVDRPVLIFEKGGKIIPWMLLSEHLFAFKYWNFVKKDVCVFAFSCFCNIYGKGWILSNMCVFSLCNKLNLCFPLCSCIFCVCVIIFTYWHVLRGALWISILDYLCNVYNAFVCEFSTCMSVVFVCVCVCVCVRLSSWVSCERRWVCEIVCVCEDECVGLCVCVCELPFTHHHTLKDVCRTFQCAVASP